MKKETKRIFIFLIIYISLIISVNFIPVEKNSEDLKQITPEVLNEKMKVDVGKKINPLIELFSGYLKFMYGNKVLENPHTEYSKPFEDEYSTIKRSDIKGNLILNNSKEKINILLDLHDEYADDNRYFKIVQNGDSKYGDDIENEEEISAEIIHGDNVEIVLLRFNKYVDSIYVNKDKLYCFEMDSKESFNRKIYMTIYDIKDFQNIEKILDFEANQTDGVSNFILDNNIYFNSFVILTQGMPKFKDGELLEPYKINGKESTVKTNNIYMHKNDTSVICNRMVKFNMDDQNVESLYYLGQDFYHIQLTPESVEIHELFRDEKLNFNYFLKNNILNVFGFFNKINTEKQNYKKAIYIFDKDNFKFKDKKTYDLDEFDNVKLSPLEMFRELYMQKIPKKTGDFKIFKKAKQKEKYMNLQKTHSEVFPIIQMEQKDKDKIVTYSIKEVNPKKYKLFINLFKLYEEDFKLLDQKVIDFKIDKSDLDEEDFSKEDIEGFINIKVEKDNLYIIIDNEEVIEFKSLEKEKPYKLNIEVNSKLYENVKTKINENEMGIFVFDIQNNSIEEKTYFIEKYKGPKSQDKDLLYYKNIYFNENMVYINIDNKLKVFDLDKLKINTYNLE